MCINPRSGESRNFQRHGELTSQASEVNCGNSLSTRSLKLKTSIGPGETRRRSGEELAKLGNARSRGGLAWQKGRWEREWWSRGPVGDEVDMLAAVRSGSAGRVGSERSSEGLSIFWIWVEAHRRIGEMQSADHHNVKLFWERERETYDGESRREKRTSHDFLNMDLRENVFPYRFVFHFPSLYYYRPQLFPFSNLRQFFQQMFMDIVKSWKILI